jgi:hypothetical protein
MLASPPVKYFMVTVWKVFMKALSLLFIEEDTPFAEIPNVL